jgi:putative iron-dependent peroxidase
VFRVAPEADPRAALTRFAGAFDPAWGVAGIGAPLACRLGCAVAGLRPFPALAGARESIPATQQALWVLLRGEERGTVFDRAGDVAALLAGGFVLDDAVDTFTYREGRDLTGYLDGTANPDEAESPRIAFVADGAPLAGSSYVAVQRWVHDLARFHAHSPQQRDLMMGRRLADNEEIDDAPDSAHVKRSAQEAFEPEAFMVRRSMPWATPQGQGLEFIAYGHSFDAFEAVLRRMAGIDDGITDALFDFARPVTGGYYWCPPLANGKLDLAALGL